MLCRVRNKIMYVLLWRTVSALTRVLFWYLLPSLLRNSRNKHQNNPLVSAQRILHSSTYIILYVFISLCPGGFEWNLRWVIFRLVLVIDGCGIACEIALRWMSLNFTDDQSTTLVQVLAWCCQTTIHNLSQCWPRSLSPNGAIEPRWFDACIVTLLWWLIWEASLISRS